MKNKLWYTNGEKDIQVAIGVDPPVGFYRGRKPVSAQVRNKIHQSMLDKTEEEKEIINRKRSESLKQTFQNKSEEEKQARVDKARATINNKSEEEKLAYRKLLSERTLGKNKGKTPWNKGLTKETDERVAANAEHTKQTNIIRARNIKEENPDYFTHWRNQINDKMRENNTFNTSQPEDEYYEYLKTIYTEDDIIRQYKEERYPFNCDFYIKSQDLFIECNFHWTHGNHPFNPNNEEDIAILENWKEKAKTSDFYKNAIDTWTNLDVRKHQVAKANNLNYQALY